MADEVEAAPGGSFGRRSVQPRAKAARPPGGGTRLSWAPPGSPCWPSAPRSFGPSGARTRLVELGKARAQALGWPDVYAYSKALSEWALLEACLLVAIDLLVRPSRASRPPSPSRTRDGFGALDGRPDRQSYARGLLEEFPGIPQGVIDVIPVDLLWPTSRRAARVGRVPGGPRRSAGSVWRLQPAPLPPARRPLSRTGSRPILWPMTRANLIRRPGSSPVLSPGGGEYKTSSGSHPGLRGGRKRRCKPRPCAEASSLGGQDRERREEAEGRSHMSSSTAPIPKSEAVFKVDRLLALYDLLSPEEREEFLLRPQRHRLAHVPAGCVPAGGRRHARVREATPRRHRPGPAPLSREERARRAVLSPDRQLAVFDLENTLIATNVVDSYAWLATRRMGLPNGPVHRAHVAEAPRMLSLDMVDRGDFLRWFYRRYEDADLAELSREAWEMTSDLLAAKAFPAGIRRVRGHRASATGPC